MQILLGLIKQASQVSYSVIPPVNKPLIQWAGNPGSQTLRLSSSQTASWHSRAKLWAGLFHFRGSPLVYFFLERGIWLLSSGSSPVSNARLACKQAAGRTPSFPQQAACWCDTYPAPITPLQPALIDLSNPSYLYLYFIWDKSVVCTCVYVCVCVLWICVCVCMASLLRISLDEASSLLLVVDMDPFSP